jgi:hypothetical protein
MYYIYIYYIYMGVCMSVAWIHFRPPRCFMRISITTHIASAFINYHMTGIFTSETAFA